MFLFQDTLGYIGKLTTNHLWIKVVAAALATMDWLLFDPTPRLLYFAGFLSFFDWVVGRRRAVREGVYDKEIALDRLFTKAAVWLLLISVWWGAHHLEADLGIPGAVFVAVLFTFVMIIEEWVSIDRNLGGTFLRPVFQFFGSVVNRLVDASFNKKEQT